MEIRTGDLGCPATQALLRLHAAEMEAASPADHCHYLDESGLGADDVDFWTVWDGDTLLGCGALKALGGEEGEIKSMRTAPGALRRGVAAAMLAHILAIARSRGMRRLSLETGSGPAFEPALALYRRHGFVECPAFGGYRASAFNRFLTLAL